MSCIRKCNQGMNCTCAFPLATGQGRKSPESVINADDMQPIDTAESAILWLIAIAGSVICLYLIVVFLQFIGV